MRGLRNALACETSGLAPSISRKSVRGRSGKGSWLMAPYSSRLATNRLLMSWEPGEYWCGEFSRFMNNPCHRLVAYPNAAGLPR